MAKLSEQEITQHLEGLAGWSRNGDVIQKTFKLQTFPAATAFVLHMAFLAEAASHHPDIDIRYNRVIVGLTTHDVGGLSAKDFELAAAIDEIIV